MRPNFDHELTQRIQGIRLLAMDVDGVLTEGKVIYTEGKNELACFNIKDGMGMTLAKKVGLKIAIITGRTSELVGRRAADLHCSDLFQGIIKKREAFEQLLKKYALIKEQVCYIGDDINDLPVLQEVGLAVAVADAVEEVREKAHYITLARGGCGAVREVIDIILYSQGLYQEAIKAFQ